MVRMKKRSKRQSPVWELWNKMEKAAENKTRQRPTEAMPMSGAMPGLIIVMNHESDKASIAEARPINAKADKIRYEKRAASGEAMRSAITMSATIKAKRHEVDLSELAELDEMEENNILKTWSEACVRRNEGKSIYREHTRHPQQEDQ